MPAAAAPGKGGIQRGLPPAPPPSAPPSGLGGAIADAFHGVGQAVSQATHSATTPHTSSGPGSDVSTGNGYGSPEANAYKQSANYRQAIVDTFRHQGAAQQKAIVQGALKNPKMPENQLVLNYVKKIGSGPSGPTNLADIAPGATKLLPAVFNATTSAPSGIFKVLKNAATDAWNLPGGTVEGLYGLGKDVVTGHEGNAFHMLVDPYVQLLEHPLKTFENHPLNTALMLSGPKHLAGTAAGGLARTGMLGDDVASAASTVRDPLHLGTVAGAPSPITEARDYSPDVINKAIQVSREKYLRSRGRNPNVSSPKPGIMPDSIAQALNVGTDAKLRRISDEMTSVRQMSGREDRARVLNELHKAAPGKESRNIVSHVLQGVIRTPETAEEDIGKEINRLKAAQTGARTPGEIWNRSQVRDLDTARKTPGAVDDAFTAAAKLRSTLNAQDEHLVTHGLLDANQAMRSKLMPYAIAHMGARPGKAIAAQFEHDSPIAAGLERADGSRITSDEILKHIQDNGVPDPAYVGHFPGKVSPGRFYSTYKLARGTLGGKRTGMAFQRGAYDHTYDGLAGQVASRAEAVTKSTLHDKVINRLGIVPPRELLNRLGIRASAQTGMLTPQQARLVADAALHDDHGNRIPGATELTPITAAGVKVLDEVKNLQHPKELENVSGVELAALEHAIKDASGRTDSTANVVLVPTVAVQRFAQQFKATDQTMRSLGKVTQQFRRTVLPYSTHWMSQIASEAGLRGLLGGVLDPRYLRDGRALMSHLEGSEEGRAALQEMVNATFYNKRDPLAVRNPNPGVIASAAKAFPPSRALIAAHNHYADRIGQTMYSLEHTARLMALGKLAHKDVQSFGFSWQNAIRLQGHSLADLATRLKSDPALVAKFGRSIDETFGKYNKFSPRVRAAIQSYAPFLPWYLNAARYVMWHLPAKHPVASALLASLRQTINQDVADGKQAPLNAYSMQELARITPFGIFTPPSTKPSTGAALAGQGLTGAILPQLGGSMYNLAGVNSFGSGPLKQPPSGSNYRGDTKPLSGPALASALSNLVESLLPGVRYARLAREGGKPAYGTSTLLDPQPKSGEGQTSVLNRILNPFYSFERAGGAGPAYGSSSTAAPGSSGGSGLGSFGGPSGGGGGSGSLAAAFGG